jgi:hypothetical protein
MQQVAGWGCGKSSSVSSLEERAGYRGYQEGKCPLWRWDAPKAPSQGIIAIGDHNSSGACRPGILPQVISKAILRAGGSKQEGCMSYLHKLSRP